MSQSNLLKFSFTTNIMDGIIKRWNLQFSLGVLSYNLMFDKGGWRQEWTKIVHRTHRQTTSRLFLFYRYLLVCSLQTTWSTALGYPGRKRQNKNICKYRCFIPLRVLSVLFLKIVVEKLKFYLILKILLYPILHVLHSGVTILGLNNQSLSFRSIQHHHKSVHLHHLVLSGGI